MPKTTFTDSYREMLAILVAARRSAGLTQIELSARLGKPQSWVSNVERGHRRVDVIEFCAIARALGSNPTTLFGLLIERLPAKLVI
jgi:transcriptional regulator with XRE-family HTH domain